MPVMLYYARVSVCILPYCLQALKTQLRAYKAIPGSGIVMRLYTVYLPSCRNCRLKCSVLCLNTKMNNLLSVIFKRKTGVFKSVLRLYAYMELPVDCNSWDNSSFEGSPRHNYITYRLI